MGDVVKVVENVSKEVSKGVSNITKEVSKGAGNIVNETSKGLNLTGQVVGNVGTFVGGDVGKAINAATAPAGAMFQAGGSLVKGDLKGAAARSTGAFIAGNTGLINGSTTVESLARNDVVNSVTLGWSNDAAQLNDASRRMIHSGDITSQDLSAIGRFGGRTALLIGAGAGASSLMGGGSGAGSALSVKATTAASSAGAAVGSAATTTAGTVATAVIGKEISRALNPQQASEPTKTTTVKASSGSFMPLLMVVGVGSVVLALLKRK